MSGPGSPGLICAPRIRLRRVRCLPVAGRVLVEPGEIVGIDQVVARAQLPEVPVPVQAAALIGVPPRELAAHLRVQAGDPIEAGQILAESRSFFGFMVNRAVAPVAGTVEAISNLTGQLMIRPAPTPLELRAFVPGTVVRVLARSGVEIDAEVTAVQGIFGLGGEQIGPLRRVADQFDQPIDKADIRDEYRGSVLLGGGTVTGAALARMSEVGALGIVTGSAHGGDLLAIAGPGLNPASTGDESIGFTLVLTEGFGEIGMSPQRFELLAGLEGALVALSGATQVRAGVIRPEIISLPTGGDPLPAALGQAVALGSAVRIVRGSAFGQIGRIEAIPGETELLGSGGRALVYRVRLEDGSLITVPRPNVELIS